VDKDRDGKEGILIPPQSVIYTRPPRGHSLSKIVDLDLSKRRKYEKLSGSFAVSRIGLAAPTRHNRSTQSWSSYSRWPRSVTKHKPARHAATFRIDPSINIAMRCGDRQSPDPLEPTGPELNQACHRVATKGSSASLWCGHVAASVPRSSEQVTSARHQL
jgi:hypothetical protein